MTQMAVSSLHRSPKLTKSAEKIPGAEENLDLEPRGHQWKEEVANVSEESPLEDFKVLLI